MYTNAQVAALVQSVDARLARVEAALAGAPAQVAAPVATTPVAIPARDARTSKVACSKHLDHKDGKGFSRAGIVAHRTWCDGDTVAVPAQE